MTWLAAVPGDDEADNHKDPIVESTTSRVVVKDNQGSKPSWATLEQRIKSGNAPFNAPQWRGPQTRFLICLIYDGVVYGILDR